MSNIFRKLHKGYRRWHQLRSLPLRIEFVLTDHCNLNCVGCTHYSSLAPKEYAPLDVLESDMAQIATAAASEIKMVYLIGGETLLYPQLTEAMRAARKYFPKQELYIFTNGIALPRMDDEFWQTAKETDFIIAITRYPIKFDYDAVIAECERRGVRTSVFADRGMKESFFRFALDPTKSQNGRMSHFKCFNRGCLSVVGTRLYPCSISACVGHLNNAKGTNFQHESGDWIEVSQIKSAKQIKQLRDRPVPFCGYCIYPADTVKYGPSKRDVTEWVETPGASRDKE